jgi:hypothetical protein
VLTVDAVRGTRVLVPGLAAAIPAPVVEPQVHVLGRVLLLDAGQVVFSRNEQLVSVRGTGLGPLDTGAWPCGDGNLRGNPVAFLG